MLVPFSKASISPLGLLFSHHYLNHLHFDDEGVKGRRKHSEKFNARYNKNFIHISVTENYQDKI
jgi:hypothetical protein